MNVIFVGGIRIAALALLAALASGPANPLNPPPESPAEESEPWKPRAGSRLQAHVKVSWGYGCGGHCAFNYRGESSVTAAFGKKHTVSVKDEGELTQMMSFPDSGRDVIRKWAFQWKGKWSSEQGVITLALKAKSLKCKTEEWESGKKTKGTCPLPPKELRLLCAEEKVEVEKTKKGDPGAKTSSQQRALVCRAEEDMLSYHGTEFPWAMGLDAQLYTLMAGEPEPETSYSLDPFPAD